MSQIAVITPVALPALPVVSVRQVLPWLIFAALLAVVGAYFVGAEQGATSLICH